ncbi:MAG: protein kinase domain-containing protein [Planctomycetota bacterium]
MSLVAGQTLSHYEILGRLGAGAMGEVWRARDSRLGREVAIKVLPAEVASDPDRLRRFEREARALASLSHPHVAQVYGIDEAGGIAFMVMELVPGEDLAARLSRGALPLDEAVDVCRQIAEGLEAAHEAGVVHRDLKPANVQLTPEGHVKLLDFGLAKAVGPQPDSGEVSRAEIDSALLTEEGRVLGTPVYMSPEQARGRSIDRRTDLWSLGCVLYECLTGRRPFAGKSPSDVIASILKEEPDWSALPPVPPRIDELLRRCLKKDARMRLRDAGEARVQLALAAGEPLAASSSSPAARAAGRAPLRAALFGVVGLATGVALALVLTSDDDAAGMTGAAVGADAPASRHLRYTLTSFDEPTNLTSLELSPAADAVAWLDERGLHVRRLDELTARRLRDGKAMEMVSGLCWSPDSRELAWAQKGTLWRLPVDGVEPIRIGELGKEDSALVHWGNDGRLLTVQNASFAAQSAAGSSSEVVFNAGDNPDFHFDGATVLPDGHGILVIPHRPGSDRETVERIVNGERRLLARYEGWDLLGLEWAGDRLFLLTTSDSVSRWWWVDCPPDAEGPLGEPRPTPFNSAETEFGPGGTVAWLAQEGQVESQLVRVSPDGAMRTMGRRHEGSLIPAPQITDGRRLLFGLGQDSWRSSSIWAHDLVRGVDTFVVKPATVTPVVVALQDGRFIASSFMPPRADLYPSHANAGPEPLNVDGMVIHATPDGGQLLFSNPKNGDKGPLSWDDLRDEAPPVVLRENAPMNVLSARFSPDGRWLVFIADDSGENQAYLSAVPPDGREWQVSIDATDLAWFSAAGDAILLVQGGADMNDSLTLRRVSLRSGAEPELGLPELVRTFEGKHMVLVGTIPGSEDLYGAVEHPPVTHGIVIEMGWLPDEK